MAITLSLQLNGLLGVNSHHLEAGYIGLQGRLSIESEPNALQTIAQQANKAGFPNLLRRDEKRLIHFQLGSRHIAKFIRLQTLSDQDYQQRFQHITSLTDKKDHFIANRILQRHFMENVEFISGIYHQDPTQTLKIKQLYFIDTGFLSTEPILYIRESQYQDLLIEPFPEYNILEFSDASEYNIDAIKELIADSAKQQYNSHISIHDLLVDTRESREFFDQLQKVQWALISIVLLLVVLTVVTAVGIILALKRRSFSTLILLGLSKQELAIHVSALTSLGFFASTAFAIAVYFLSFDNILAALAIPAVTFTPFGMENFILICSFGIITSSMSFYAVYKH